MLASHVQSTGVTTRHSASDQFPDNAPAMESVMSVFGLLIPAREAPVEFFATGFELATLGLETLGPLWK